jgi:hypothetical protein
VKINLRGKQFGELNMMNLQTQTAVRYCDTINSRYRNNANAFQNLKDRLNSTLASYPLEAQKYKRYMLSEAIKEFQRRFPSVTKFKQLRLCKAQLVKLSDIRIDDTIQRKLDIDWVIKILSNFNEFQVQPVQVYHIKGTANQLLFASWDGQHTAIALYVVAIMILQDTDDVEIPATIYEVSLKSEIRENFIKGNGPEGKKLLAAIDLYHQMIYGVRCDGSTNKIWVEAEKKQQHLEQNGLFVTADKFGDTDQAGAISRLDEINKYDPAIIKELAMYLGLSVQDQRPVDPKEMYIMGSWFAMNRDTRAEYTQEDMYKLYNILKDKFNADFRAEVGGNNGPFWQQVEDAYLAYKRKEKAIMVSMYGEDFANSYFKEPRLNKDWIQGGTYLWHLLKKSYTGPMPELSINTPFVPEI